MAEEPHTPGTDLDLPRRELEGFVADQRRRIRRRFLLHGAGWLVAIVAGCLLAYYLKDRALELPPALRVLISLGVVGLLAHQVRRRIVQVQRHRLRRDDVAVVIERRFPELREQLISAVQLGEAQKEGHLRNQSQAMIESLVREASAGIRSLPHIELLDNRRTTRVWAAAAGLVVATSIAVIADPSAFGVFLRRALGADESYPRLTTLHVELPSSGNEYRIERPGGRVAKVTMAAGDDLPVLVRVVGKVPAGVYLAVEGGRGVAPEIAMSARGPDRFRHVFRRVSSGFSFHAFGGDDPRGDLTVEVTTVRPPRVATIRATLTSPTYTGMEPVTQLGGSLEALEGTTVQLQVRATQQVAGGTLHFLESGREIELSTETVTDDQGSRQVLDASFVVERSDRYQVRLVSPSGLNNPHPGTYPLVAISDRAPIGRILTPADDGLDLVLPGGLIPLRLAAQDDFGLGAIEAIARVGKDETEARFVLSAGTEGPTDRRSLVLTTLFEAADLPTPGKGAAVGDSVTLAAAIRDRREPEAQETEIPGRQVHVVGAAHLATRISGHFRRVREATDELRDRQVDLQSRLDEVEERLGSGENRTSLRGDITVIQVGQARVHSAATRLHADLMRAFDLHLFNRLDDSPNAAKVVELYVSYHRDNPVAEGFLPGFYQQIAVERREGRLGPMTKALDPILDMTLICDRVATELAPQTTKGLDRAVVAGSTSELGAALTATGALQARMRQDLDALVAMLEEWSDFQDVVTQTRAVLDKQREVQVRTRDSLRGGREERKKR